MISCIRRHSELRDSWKIIELTTAAVNYGIFMEKTFISHIPQALVTSHHFLLDLITTAIFVLLIELYPNRCHSDALIGKGHETLGKARAQKVFTL